MDTDTARPDVPVLTFVGGKVALGPRRRDLAPTYQRWFNDFAVMGSWEADVLGPATLDSVQRLVEEADKREDAEHFTVYEKETPRPIGLANLHRINHAHRVGSFGLFIGERYRWEMGCGTETTRLVLAYAFGQLDLHSVALTVFADDEPAIRTYLRGGFRHAGRWREAHRREGKLVDVLHMDCLAMEFSASPGGGR